MRVDIPAKGRSLVVISAVGVLPHRPTLCLVPGSWLLIEGPSDV